MGAISEELEGASVTERAQVPAKWNLVPVHRAYEKFLGRIRRKQFSQREVEHDLRALIKWAEVALSNVKNHPLSEAASPPHPGAVEKWWRALPAKQQKAIKRTLRGFSDPPWNAREWEQIMDHYARTILRNPRGWERGRNV